jgi:predicted amidophosphoribosyltransferase
MSRERTTVEAMIRLHCRGRHAGGRELCGACRDLLEYAQKRLDTCPFQEGKPTCAKCPVHCYRRDMREQVRVVMRYAGPRMLYRHPLLALWHLLDGLRKEPLPSSRRAGSP